MSALNLGLIFSAMMAILLYVLGRKIEDDPSPQCPFYGFRMTQVPGVAEFVGGHTCLLSMDGVCMYTNRPQWPCDFLPLSVLEEASSSTLRMRLADGKTVPIKVLIP